MPLSAKLLATLSILAAVILWGGSYVAIKAALAAVTPLDLVAVRLLLALPTLILLVLFSKQKILLRAKWGSVGLISIVLFFHFYIMSEGIRETSASHSAWLLTIAPLVTTLLAWLCLKEKLTWRHWVGMGLASAGVIVLDFNNAVISTGIITSRGNFLVLATCGTWALYTILIKRLTSTIPPLVGTLWTVAFATLGTVPIALSQGFMEHASQWPTSVYGHLLYLGIGCLALAFWLWSEGLRIYSAAESSLYLYVEPLITVLVAWLLLGEIPTGWLWVGAAAIGMGVQLAEFKPKGVRP